jgi:hypothetical protein
VTPPEFVLEINSREVILKNYEDQVYRYPQVQASSNESGELDACGQGGGEHGHRPISIQRLP